MSQDVDNEIRSQIDRLLSRPIDDEAKVLEIIIQAITSKYAKPELVEQAVRQSVHNYETRLRIFQIAAAHRQLQRIANLIDMCEKIEKVAFSPEMVKKMEPRDLVALYGKAQATIKEGMDHIKNIVNARLEAANAQTAMLSTIQQKDQIQVDSSGIYDLDSMQRDKVRRIVDGIAESITSISEGDVSLKEDKGDKSTSLVPTKGGNGDPRLPR